MKISVIIPVYKAELFLSRCLDSLRAQTHGDLEILLVDDGSPDGSGAVCDAYARIDPRLRVFHTENRGAFAARNLALDMATGDYIGFVDADDWVAPTMYERLLALALEHEADVAQCEMQDEGSYRQNRSQSLGGARVYERQELTGAFFREEITHGLLNKLFHRRCWEDRRFLEGYYHVDAMTLAELPAMCGRLVRTDEALYHYNTGNESITRGKKKLLHLHSMEKLFAAFSAAAERAPAEGGFFICKEIPSGGRLLLPSEDISRREALRHLRYMHKLFKKHWPRAKEAEAYKAASPAKKAFWKLYGCCPLLASALRAMGYRQPVK